MLIEGVIAVSALLSMFVIIIAGQLFIKRIKINKSKKKLEKGDILKAIIHATFFVAFLFYLISLFFMTKKETIVEDVSSNIYKVLPLYFLDKNDNPILSEDKFAERSESKTRFFYKNKTGKIGVIETKNKYISHQDSNESSYYVEETVTKETEVEWISFWRVKRSDEETIYRYIIHIPADAILFNSNF